MERFNLDIWLQAKSRKVVTRDRKPVRIVCWDKLGDYPIIGCIKYSDDYEDFETYNIDGSKYSFNREDPNDLFFADEELTEFEKELQTIISEASHWTSEDGSISTYCQFGDKEIKKISAQVLDLARKEILKDLPKWKDVSGKNGAGTKDYKIVGYYLVKGNYAIYLEDLEKLPKEE